MTARELEAALLARCTVVARGVVVGALDQCEANVFHLAATVVRAQFPAESENLRQASEQYFAQNPNERLSLTDNIKNGWVVSLPRLRDMLSQRLTRE
ncbi:hypothetical protein CBP36_21405 (plasmid) [Acidovorax carolinensis]|uniref:Uncharacterized protein n=1 Tax=Acidovorax carolinensis TaxID=553814 RepID=A0A240UK87_9BURK|nr:hypothetical protein [Acidovorax carolinensis]ART61525.1 hypothetical protein CBP36_21405 [Acidovorax carolinensis]